MFHSAARRSASRQGHRRLRRPRYLDQQCQHTDHQKQAREFGINEAGVIRKIILKDTVDGDSPRQRTSRGRRSSRPILTGQSVVVSTGSCNESCPVTHYLPISWPITPPTAAPPAVPIPLPPVSIAPLTAPMPAPMAVFLSRRDILLHPLNMASAHTVTEMTVIL
jgi:hypothetical protein